MSLVFNLGPGEGFTVGAIHVRVVRRHHGHIEIVVDAPPSVRILRDNAVVREPKPPAGAPGEFTRSVNDREDGRFMQPPEGGR